MSQTKLSRRRWPVAVTGILATAALATAWLLLMPSPADGEPATGVIEIEIVENAFTPPVIEVAEGTTVTWTFTGDKPHNVVGEGWGDEAATTRGTVSQTFDEAGTYRYSCTLHSGMDGRVEVVPTASGASS